MAFTRILIFTLFVTLTLLETALTRNSSELLIFDLEHHFESNKIIGTWYVLGMITAEPPNDLPSCMTMYVTENNNTFTFKIISTTSTGRRGPEFVTRVNNTNPDRSTPGYNVSLGDFLNFLSADYYEAVIKYHHDSLRYLIMSRDFSTGLHDRSLDLARANNFYYTKIPRNNCY
ncbi:hypothetical protein PV328_007559 [Microctonus aethiopoides]|uniref:Lipocalin/cytosolic fatty-acid binding domain-containing protein n=1 Tax=Microctonus aethiopoides TaxID=144406 RepID=A0AA39C8Z4_9HYME|nr:hypothetical protein PV328_007559 [Microctonus aethiopoides]